MASSPASSGPQLMPLHGHGHPQMEASLDETETENETEIQIEKQQPPQPPQPPPPQSPKRSSILTSTASLNILPLFPAHLFRRRQYASLLYLPMELQLLICANLSYGDLQRLRCTNRFYRQLISIDFVRICLGSLATDAELRFVCRTCNRYDPIGRRLVWPLAQRAQPDPVTGRLPPDPARAAGNGNGNENGNGNGNEHNGHGHGHVHDDDNNNINNADDDDDGLSTLNVTLPPDHPGPEMPLSAHCADCAVRARQLSPGEYVLMEAGERKVRVCRWCGWPCAGNRGWGGKDKDAEEGGGEYYYQPRYAWQLHPRCAWVYQMVIVGYYVLVCIRSGIALVTYILLWRIFPKETLVIVPSIIGFLIMGAILAIIYVRGREIRTYHVVGSLEFSILALGIPPLYVIIKAMETEYDAGMIAAEVLLVTHLVIRLVNVIGNVLLFLEYDITRHHAPDIPPFKRFLLNPLMAGLIFWTSPMALENMWIGRGKHPTHKSFRKGMVRAWKDWKRGFKEFMWVVGPPTPDP